MKPSLALRNFLFGSVLLAAVTTSSHALNFYWDTDGATTGFGSFTNQNFGTAAYWSTSSTGESTTATYALANAGATIAQTDQLYFGSTANPYSATLTVTGSAAKVITTGNYRFGGSGNIVMSSTMEIASTAGNGIRSSSTGTVTFNGVIAGVAGSISQTGSGVLTLASAANTYGSSTTAGNSITTISGGGTIKAFKLAIGGADSSLGKANTAAARLVFDNGTLTHYGTAASSTDKNFTINVGGATIENDSTDSADTLTWSGTATLDTTSGSRSFTLGGTNAGDNTFSGSLADNTATGVLSVTKADAGKWILTNTANAYTGSTTISSGTLQIGSAGRINNGAYAGDISIATTSLLQYSSSANQTLSGAITGQGGITKDTNNSDLTLSSTSNNYSGDTTVSAGRLATNGAVTNLSSGATKLVQSGTGGFYLKGAVTYTNALNLSTTGFTPTSGDTQSNSIAVRLDNGSEISNTITLSGNSRIGSFNGSTSTMSGKITGNFGIDFYGVEQGAAATTFVISNTANDYTGNTTIYNSLYNSTANSNVTSTTLKLGASNVIPNGASAGNVAFAVFSNGLILPNATTTLDLAGFSDTINGLTVNSGTFNTRITNSVTGASVLQIGDNDTTSSFGGAITEAGSGATLAITKIGSGTLTLSGTNLYTGATSVNQGTLEIAATGSTDASSAVTVSNSGSALIVNGTVNGSLTMNVSTTLSGSGTIKGAATVSGNLNPGNSPGMMVYENTLTLTNSTITTMEIDGTVGAGAIGGHDFINLTGVGAAGVLTYDGTLTLDIGTILGLGVYSWNLFDFTSEPGAFDSITLADQYSGILLDGNTDGIWDLTSGNNTWSFTESSGTLGLTVIPEPRAALLGGLGLLMLMRRRR